jgi:hypothetical protein
VPRYAAIDIGSNSIRMEAAEVAAGQPTRVLASDREVTRLGESVFRAGAVSEEALAATCAVLARMAALYRKLDVASFRPHLSPSGGKLRHDLRPVGPRHRAYLIIPKRVDHVARNGLLRVVQHRVSLRLRRPRLACVSPRINE